jgi:hypothetical protein
MRYAFVLWMAAAWGQSIDAPRIGTVLGHDGVLRALHGVAGNFTLGNEAAEKPASPSMRIVKREGAVFVVDEQGGVLDALPAEARAVLAIGEAIVYATDEELVLRHADHSELHFALRGVTMLRTIGADYVQAGGHALRISSGQLYVLPQPDPLSAVGGRRR